MASTPNTKSSLITGAVREQEVALPDLVHEHLIVGFQLLRRHRRLVHTLDPPASADSNQRANATCRQQLNGGRKIRGRFNGSDVVITSGEHDWYYETTKSTSGPCRD